MGKKLQKNSPSARRAFWLIMRKMQSVSPLVSPVARGTLPVAALSRRVFGGEILLFPGAARPVLRAARAAARRAFAPAHPPAAHRVFARDEFLRRAALAQGEFEANAEVAKHFAAALVAVGVPERRVFLDLPRLRIAPPVATHAGGLSSHIGPHRDTWGVGAQAQINWWAAVWPVARGRTICFYPGYFRRALANTTATWSFAEYNAARRAAPPGRRPDYPSAPVPLEAPDESPTALAPGAGDLLCFSAAHLHGSVANATGLTRFSVEVRSADPEDVRAGRGAPNADCATAKTILGLFRAPRDGTPLSRFLAAKD